MTSFENINFDLQKVARKNILELLPYRCARDVINNIILNYIFLLSQYYI